MRARCLDGNVRDMTISMRGRWLLVLIAAVISPLATVAPASAATVIRTSTAVRGLAWESTVDASGAFTFAPSTETADGGVTWATGQIAEIAGADQVRWAIGRSDDGSDPGALLTSSDGGVTWHDVPALAAVEKTIGRPYGLVEVADIAVDPDRPGVVYAIIVLAEGNSEAFTVVESIDDGANWTPWTKYLFASSSNDVPAWRPIPGRDAFVVIDAGTGAGIQTISVATPTRDRTVMLQRPTTGHVWTGGLQVDRSGSRVLVQTTRGWMLSTDGGAHLHALGLPKAVSPVFDPSGSGRIYALRGGTLFHSADAGRHWQRRGRAPAESGLAVDRGGLLVYAFGPGGDLISRDGGRTFQAVAPA